MHEWRNRHCQKIEFGIVTIAFIQNDQIVDINFESHSLRTWNTAMRAPATSCREVVSHLLLSVWETVLRNVYKGVVLHCGNKGKEKCEDIHHGHSFKACFL